MLSADCCCFSLLRSRRRLVFRLAQRFVSNGLRDASFSIGQFSIEVNVVDHSIRAGDVYPDIFSKVTAGPSWEPGFGVGPTN